MASTEHKSFPSIPAHSLPNGWPRISKSNPVRDLGAGVMDYERCAALHNELLTIAVKGRGGEMPAKPLTWWEARAPSEEIASTLHPSLIEFLKRAWDEDIMPPYSAIFLFIGALKFPEGLRDYGYLVEEEGEEGRFIKLYQLSFFRGLDDEGLMFDQKTLKASFLEDYSDTWPITSHEWSWMPLEVILDSYLQMIDEGKVQTVSEDEAKLVKREDPFRWAMDQWVIHYYTQTDLERATAAFKRLIEAIESRIPNSADPNPIGTPINLPWHDPATFSNEDILPPYSFAHKFLKAISNIKVRFRYIAPGIRFPTVSEFQDQPITNFVKSPYNHHGQYIGDCPLRIFEIDDAEQNLMPYEHNFGLRNFAPGFYIQRVVQRWHQFWSNGCRLLLPFGIGRSGWARMSNGEPLGILWSNYTEENPKPHDAYGDLYQGGTVNGITNTHAVQIDKVLNNWAERVERGDWGIDGNGVVGGIEKFREADTEKNWEKYWIAPSW